MNRRTGEELTCGRRVLLAAVAFAAIAGPVSVGVLHPRASRAQSQAGKQQLSFEVASVKASPPPSTGHSPNYRMSGGPGTKDPSRFTCETSVELRHTRNCKLWLHAPPAVFEKIIAQEHSAQSLRPAGAAPEVFR